MFDEVSDRRVGDLHVRVAGVGSPVLLIHGNSGDLHYFDDLVAALTDRHRVAAMDCRGQGRSARGDGPLTIPRMAEDAADVIRAVAVRADEPFHVVGFSDGANVAMVLAARHPELVCSLVLNAGNVSVAGLRTALRIQLFLADAALRLRIARSARLTRRHELIGLMRHDPGVTEAELRAVAVPALVIAGSRDVIRPAHTRHIAALLPDARLRIVAGGTHFALRDMPDTVVPMITTFLDAQPSS